MFERALISLVVAVATTFWITPKLMKAFKAIGIYGIDQQKNGEIIPEAGGISVAAGVFTGILTYITLSTFLITTNVSIIVLLASLLSIVIITMVGFMDDLFTGRSKNMDVHGDVNYRKGLSQKTKALLVLPAAIPLMAISAGNTIMQLPFLGAVDFGIFYTFLIIPIALLCVSNSVNMLAGLNGLESGMAAVALAGLSVFGLLVGSYEASAIAMMGAACFATFLIFYNRYPARVFPGDSGTYLAGGMIATVVIIGEMQKFGIIIFIPWIIEAFIKLRGRFKGTSFGKLNEAGFVKPKNGKIESLTHVVMSLGNFREWQISAILWGVEAVFVLLALGLYFIGAI